MKPSKKLLFPALVLFALLIGAFGYIHTLDRRTAEAAEELVLGGDYEGARLLFEELEDTENVSRCDELILEREYNVALKLLDEEKFDSARNAFLALEGYRDSEELAVKCDFLKARSYEERGYYLDAMKLYDSLGSCPGCEEARDAAKPKLYRRALEQCREYRIEEAAKAFEYLGDYEESTVLLSRCRRILEWDADRSRKNIIDEKNAFPNSFNRRVYECDEAYVILPDTIDINTKYLLYYPGGRNAELYIDYLYCFIENPPEDAISVFLKRNGVTRIADKNTEVIELLDRIGLECRVFLNEMTVCGSSLGAYCAIHSPIYAKDYAVKINCVLTFSCGASWGEAELLLDEREMKYVSETGTDYYLFESRWLGTNNEAIRQMVEFGMNITMVGCVYDEHNRLTFDALGMGVLKWAVGDRKEPYVSDIYTFTKMQRGVEYPVWR